MARYFIQLSYFGKDFAGFQIQKNAPTIQGAVEDALFTYLRKKIELTGSSRTDKGVHALQNFFHFDAVELWTEAELEKMLYHVNAILPPDIAIQQIKSVAAEAHSRFDATYRKYQYQLYNKKNPFLFEKGYYFPFPLAIEKMQAAAAVILNTTNFKSFAKVHSQVHTHNCTIFSSAWLPQEDGSLIYEVKANRFLRGMVKALVGTMLQVGRGKIDMENFQKIIDSGDCTLADFSPPGHGLYLVEVGF